MLINNTVDSVRCFLKTTLSYRKTYIIEMTIQFKELFGFLFFFFYCMQLRDEYQVKKSGHYSRFLTSSCSRYEQTRTNSPYIIVLERHIGKASRNIDCLG